MTTTGEMSCQELVEVITEYLEGTLPPDDRERFEEHLRACPYCEIYLRQMRTTIALVGRLSEDSIPEDAKRQLLDAFRDWKRG